MIVTACLITYERPDNINTIISHLLRQPFIGNIIVRNNSTEENTMTYGRYQTALLAPSDFVFTQDDDCIVTDIDRIFQAFQQDPGRLTFGLAPSHYPLWKDFTYPESQLGMMGWGAFFNKEWIEPAFNAYRKAYPVDNLLYREADRIFSVMLGKQHRPILTENLRHLAGHSDGKAMWLEREHFRSRDTAITRCRNLLKVLKAN